MEEAEALSCQTEAKKPKSFTESLSRRMDQNPEFCKKKNGGKVQQRVHCSACQQRFLHKVVE